MGMRVVSWEMHHNYQVQRSSKPRSLHLTSPSSGWCGVNVKDVKMLPLSILRLIMCALRVV